MFLWQTRKINMNKFGDDFVSFTPLHITFSPDGQFFLISTGTYYSSLPILGLLYL